MSGLNADSSDEESFLVSRGTNLNSQSSGEEDNVRGNLNSQSSGEEDNVQRNNLNSQGSGEEDNIQRDKAQNVKRKSQIASSDDNSDNEEKLKGL